METASGAAHQYCTFTINGRLFGIEVTRVREVLKTRELSPVPLAPGAIEGLLNLRGQIVTAIDLRRRLEMPARDPSAPSMLLVVQDGDGVVALVADGVGDVLEVPARDFEVPPNTLPESSRELVTGVFKLPGQLLHLLDTEKAALVGCV